MQLRVKRKGVPAVSLVVIAGLALAACGSGAAASSGSKSTVTSKVSSVSSSVISAISAAEQLPSVIAPGPAFDAKKAAGKTVWVVGTSSSVPILALQNKAMTKALALVGVKVDVFSTDGSPGSWVNAINSAVAHNANAIVLEGTNPSLLVPQLASARAAHIPIVYDFAVPGPVSKVAPQATATVSLPFPTSGKLMADEAIKATHGHAVVEMIGLNTQLQNPVYENSIKSELKAKCPGCKIAGYLNAPISDWSNTLTNEVVSLLHRKPSINVLMAFYDGTVEFILPGVTQAGAAGHVFIVASDGTPSVLGDIGSGNVVVGDAGISNTWQAWATADQTLRLLVGAPPVANENIPTRLWTKGNIAQVKSGGGSYGTKFITMYKKLWGVS